MTVHVDDLIHQGYRLYGRPTKVCRLWADTLDELLDFAEELAIPERWFHAPGENDRVPHFRLTLRWRDRAVELGAVPLDRHEAAESQRHWDL